jgi:hypothetical protein
LDAYVAEVLCARLSRSDVADLLPLRQQAERIDTVHLATQANALRARIQEAQDLWEFGVLAAADLKVRHARLSGQLADVQARLRSAAGHSPLADLAGRQDAAEVWAGLDLGRRRAILKTLAIIWVLPLPKPPGRAPFDPTAVRIEWKQ